MTDDLKQRAEAVVNWSPQGAIIRALLAALVQAEQREAEGRKAQQLIADLLEERSDELDKDACDRCENCGPMVMCDFHSIISALQGGTWTEPAIDRDSMRRRAEAAEARLASQEATIRQVAQEMREYIKPMSNKIRGLLWARYLRWSDTLQTLTGELKP